MFNKITLAMAMLCQLPLYASSLPYVSRFAKLTTEGSMRYTAKAELQRLEALLRKFPWLENLPQPKLSVRVGDAHYQTPNLGIKGLPYKFVSDRQLVYQYPDGNKAILAYVAEHTDDYEAFLQRNKGTDIPSQVLIYTGNAITGRFLHIERPYSYMASVFKEYDYDFESFVDEVESPVINLSSGGHRLARDIARISGNRLTAFSSDLVGYEGAYRELPYYLFFDSMNSHPLPSDTFGAVMQFGGYLAKAKLDYPDIKKALQEMTRLVQPGGYLLFEITRPVTPEWIKDATQGLSKAVEYIDFYQAIQFNSHNWRSNYLVEIKFDE